MKNVLLLLLLLGQAVIVPAQYFNVRQWNSTVGHAPHHRKVSAVSPLTGEIAVIAENPGYDPANTPGFNLELLHPTTGFLVKAVSVGYPDENVYITPGAITSTNRGEYIVVGGFKGIPPSSEFLWNVNSFSNWFTFYAKFDRDLNLLWFKVNSSILPFGNGTHPADPAFNNSKQGVDVIAVEASPNGPQDYIILNRILDASYTSSGSPAGPFASAEYSSVLKVDQNGNVLGERMVVLFDDARSTNIRYNPIAISHVSSLLHPDGHSLVNGYVITSELPSGCGGPTCLTSMIYAIDDALTVVTMVQPPQLLPAPVNHEHYRISNVIESPDPTDNKLYLTTLGTRAYPNYDYTGCASPPAASVKLVELDKATFAVTRIKEYVGRCGINSVGPVFIQKARGTQVVLGYTQNENLTGGNNNFKPALLKADSKTLNAIDLRLYNRGYGDIDFIYLENLIPYITTKPNLFGEGFEAAVRGSAGLSYHRNIKTGPDCQGWCNEKITIQEQLISNSLSVIEHDFRETESIASDVIFSTYEVGMEDFENCTKNFGKPSGIAAGGKEERVRIHPNPAQGVINLSQLPEKAQISVINTVGQKMVSMQTHAATAALDCSEWPSGGYFIAVSTASGQTQTFKVTVINQ